MSDIRKRKGTKGTTYQVRYANPHTKAGYSYKSFSTLAQAKAFSEDGSTRKTAREHGSIVSVEDAIQRWLDTCEKEGRSGKDPVSKATFAVYETRADIMRAYTLFLHALKKHIGYDLQKMNERRAQYLAALRAADAGGYAPLLAFTGAE